MPESLGDKIVTIRLEATQAQDELQATTARVTQLQAELRKANAAQQAAARAAYQQADGLKKLQGAALSATGQVKVINAAAQEAHQRFGVMANAVTGASTVMRLMTGESGFLAIEMGRTTLYLGRAITAAGGLAAAFRTVALATKGFLVSIGPIGIAVGIVAAGWLAYKKIIGDTTEETDRLADAKKRLLDLQEKEIAAFQKLDAARGNVPRVVAIYKSLMGNKPPSSPEEVHTAMRAAIAEEQALRIEETKRRTADREKAFQDLGVSLGIRKLSDFMQPGPMREMQMFREFAESRRKSASEQASGGFSIGSRDASGFRFGFGAGNLIGEQKTEEKKTNALLEKINKEIAAGYKLLEQALGMTPANDFAFGPPGLP